MKKLLRCAVVVVGIFGAASANATATITATELQTYGQAVVNYLASNASTIGISAADLQLVSSAYSGLATSPQLSALATLYNGVLQSSAGCAGTGTYPNLNQANFENCASDLVNALIVGGYYNGTGTAADLNAATLGAGIALAKAAGIALTIPGTSVAVPLTTTTTLILPTTTTTTTAHTTTTTVAGATTTTLPPASAAKVVSDIVVPQIQRATSIQQASIISNVVSNIFSSRAPNSPGAPMRMSLGNEKGMSAGNQAAKLNGWVNASDTTLGNSAAGSLFDGKVTNAIAGLDYMVSDKFVAGVSVGSDRVSLDYKFAANSGLVSTGWMVAPYASYQISDIVSVDGALGYAAGDADYRDSGVISTKSYERAFGALNLNANYWINDLQLTGKVNYISAEEKVTVLNKMEQLRLVAQAGYWFGGIMPYASLTYVLDLKVSAGGIQPANLDKEAWVAAVGANLFSKGALYGGIAYTHEFGRADSKNNTFMANIGYRF